MSADSDGDTDAYDDAGFVVSSQYRIAVLTALADSDATPSTLAESTGYKITHMSRVLRSCRDRDMVELLVSEDRKKGRIYGLTERGERALEIADGLAGDA